MLFAVSSAAAASVVAASAAVASAASAAGASAADTEELVDVEIDASYGKCATDPPP